MSLKYKAFYPGKHPVEISTATTSYEAQCLAATLWDLRPSQRSRVTVVLCEKDGVPIEHLPLD